jgi:hypothetical protein
MKLGEGMEFPNAYMYEKCERQFFIKEKKDWKFVYARKLC